MKGVRWICLGRAVSGMKVWRRENGIDDVRAKAAQSLTQADRMSRLEAIIETVLPHLATQEDLARTETRSILWVVERP